MMPAQFDPDASCAIQLGLHTRDIEQSLHFYRDTLGFVPHGEIFAPGAHIYGLRFGNCVIKLLQWEAVPEASNPQEMAVGMRYFTLQVTNAVELAKECQDAGYEVVHPGGDFVPDGPGPQCTFSMVRDPEGNLIEFAQGSPWAEPIYEFPKFS